MKPFFRNTLLFIILTTARADGQLTVNVLIPPSGLMDKQQLWNIILTNTEQTPLSIQLQVSFSELSTGQPVFTAATAPIMVASGTKQLSATNVGQVQYNSLNANYRIDPGPTGLLPVGNFTVCYNFLIEKYGKVVQECQPVSIPRLGPLLLNQPSNGSILQEYYPLFSWLPLSGVQSLMNLKYDLKLVEVSPNQSAAEAIKDNLPLYTRRNLAATNYLHTSNAPSLLPGKIYAWQVTATSNLSEIAKSETWSFSIKQDPAMESLQGLEPSFIKLKKAGAGDGFGVYSGNIRFDYFNETADIVWNIRVEDLTSARHISFSLEPDSIKLHRGQNLVSYDARTDKRFVDKHHYLLQVINSQNEVWQLRFEYRKPD